MVDAKIELMSLIKTQWDVSQTPLSEQPVCHTGWYDRDGDMPCITFTNKSEGPYQGGATGLTAIHGPTGKGMQQIQGNLSINCVAGTFDDLRGAGTNGEDVNPKKAREQMYQHVCQILIDAVRTDELYSIAPGTGNEIEDTDEGSAVYRLESRPTYFYDRTPTPNP